MCVGYFSSTAEGEARSRWMRQGIRTVPKSRDALNSWFGLGLFKPEGDLLEAVLDPAGLAWVGVWGGQR